MAIQLKKKILKFSRKIISIENISKDNKSHSKIEIKQKHKKLNLKIKLEDGQFSIKSKKDALFILNGKETSINALNKIK